MSVNRIRKAAVGGALVLSTMGGGALGAALLNGSAGAQTNTTTTTAPASSSTGATTAPSPSDGQGAPQRDPSKGGHTANGITETLLTGDTAAKVTAAANAAVPGGTIERVETDAEGSKYEAHMVKADGTHVTVKVDASFKVTSVETGAG
jgi:hypothetical protein